MGIQINGITDTISATDGGLAVSGQQLTGVTDINASGIITATQGYVVGTGASVFSPAANTLALGTNDVERFRVTSTGQLQATSASDVRLTLGSSGTAGTNDSNHIRGDGTSLKFMNASGGVTLFENNGTERFRITNNGVTFNGDTASANALDDYEEGTWTITIATEGGSNYTLGNQFNRYVKVGNLVFVRFNVEFTAEGSGTIAVFNLPFTASTSETFILNGFVSQGNNRLSLQYTNYTSSAFLPRYDNGTAYVNYWTPNTAWAPPNNFVGVGCYSVN